MNINTELNVPPDSLSLKVPLDERLKRIAAGKASSPQYSYTVISKICDLPIMPSLECRSAFQEHIILRELTEDTLLQRLCGPMSIETFTLADIAQLILKVNSFLAHNKPDAKQASAVQNEKRERLQRVLTPKLEQLICIFFQHFDYIDFFLRRNRETDASLLRSFIQPPLRGVYDFLLVSLEDYTDCVKQYASSAFLQDFHCYRTKNGFFPQTSLLEIYRKLTADILKTSNQCAEDDDLFDPLHPILTYKDCLPLINYFVYPIALMKETPQDLEDQKGDN